VLRGAEPFYLSTREEKLGLLSELDLDLIIIQPFTPGLAQTKANPFAERLIQQIGMIEMWVGPDYALGYRREGDIPFLRRLGSERGFSVSVVTRLKLDGAAISSSRIRRALREGDVTLAARCLGRPYSLQGPVVLGMQRGRAIGFPTANVQVPLERAIPANGVYAAWARLQRKPVTDSGYNDLSLGHLGPREQRAATKDRSIEASQSQGWSDERHRAVVNIGTRPTFDDGPRTIEAHLLNFDRDIYGLRLTLDFVTRLRPEQRFNNIDALVAQINNDVAQARQLLHNPRDVFPGA
jgi:riboflavin kinase/FMN adenylyltransferase